MSAAGQFRMRPNAAYFAQTWDCALIAGGDALVLFHETTGRPGGRRPQKAPPRASAPPIVYVCAGRQNKRHSSETDEEDVP